MSFLQSLLHAIMGIRTAAGDGTAEQPGRQSIPAKAERKEFMGQELQIAEALVKAGCQPDENGCFRILPETLPISYETWEALTFGEKDPFAALPETLPMLKKDCETAMREDSGYFPVWSALQKQFGTESTEEFRKTRITYPETEEEWLQIPVRINLGLMVDGFADYVLNNSYPAYLGEEYDAEHRGCFHRSSIMWLTRRQGYNQAELRKAQHLVRKAAYCSNPLSLIPSRYLYSAAMEIWHELSFTNQLGFFLLVSLRETLLMCTMKQWGRMNKKWQGAVCLDVKTRCGFFDTMSGSGSLIGIELEKEVKVPLCNVQITPDSALNYPQITVHGNPSVWQPGLIRRWLLPRQFRRYAIASGIPGAYLPPVPGREGVCI